MFEFQKLCSEVESLSAGERAALLAEKTVSVVRGLQALELSIDPIDVLASFLVGSVISDGSISEKDYLDLYPPLSEALGALCDLAEIKRSFKVSADARKEVTAFTQALLGILAEADETLGEDLVLFCLLITSVDGKISLRERNYIKQICKG